MSVHLKGVNEDYWQYHFDDEGRDLPNAPDNLAYICVDCMVGYFKHLLDGAIAAVGITTEMMDRRN